MGQKNGLYAFGYNSAESELILIKFKHCEPNVGAGPDRFWRDPRSSDSLSGSRNYICEVNNARFHQFPADKFYDI